jgi:hypothetical protein
MSELHTAPLPYEAYKDNHDIIAHADHNLDVSTEPPRCTDCDVELYDAAHDPEVEAFAKVQGFDTTLRETHPTLYAAMLPLLGFAPGASLHVRAVTSNVRTNEQLRIRAAQQREIKTNAHIRRSTK